MLLALLQWIQNTPVFHELRASAYAYPIILALHLSAIAIFGGMILLTDLRLLGWALKRQSVASVFAGLRLPKRIVFTFAATMGLFLFCSKAEQYYYNNSFRTKLLLLIVIAVHTIVYRRRVYNAPGKREADRPTRQQILAGALSLTLWAGVLVAGRAIGYALPRAGLHMI